MAIARRGEGKSNAERQKEHRQRLARRQAQGEAAIALLEDFGRTVRYAVDNDHPLAYRFKGMTGADVLKDFIEQLFYESSPAVNQAPQSRKTRSKKPLHPVS